MFSTNILGGGGQAKVLHVKNIEKGEGAFRVLKSKEPDDIKRFQRELKILTNPEYFHPGVVKILDHTSNDIHNWYISEKGYSFGEFWYTRKEKLNANEVVEMAISIIKKLSYGLIKLHENGIVHRDIKPGNIIVKNDEPILIDFGLAFLDESERITNEKDVMGNRRYSPDVVMYKMKDIPPWLDIFQLSQLLIWMTADLYSKDGLWQRPLDWRWVKYPNDLNEDTCVYLRAITAVCSEYETSPKNAKEYLNLLLKFFPEEVKMKTMKIDTTQIAKAYVSGNAEKQMKDVENLLLIESSFEMFNAFYIKIVAELKELLKDLKESGISFSMNEYKCETWLNNIKRKMTNESTVYNLCTIDFKGDNGKKFTLEFCGNAFIPGVSEANVNLPKSSNVFLLSITRRNIGFKDAILTIENNGDLTLRDMGLHAINAHSVKSLIEEIKEWIMDTKVWNNLGKAG